MSDIWNALTDSFNEGMAIEEMSKKYGNTMLVISNEANTEIVVRYKGYENGFHIFEDSLGTRITLKHNTKLQVFCKFPERCLFNIETHALEFVRKPNRQYKRGICKDNVYIYSPVRQQWKLEDGHPWNIDTIRDALYPWYPQSCQEALQLLQEKRRVSIALSPKFMLSLSLNTSSDLVLFYSNIIIGTFSKGVFTILHPYFRQEVLESLELFQPYQVEFK